MYVSAYYLQPRQLVLLHVTLATLGYVRVGLGGDAVKMVNNPPEEGVLANHLE